MSEGCSPWTGLQEIWEDILETRQDGVRLKQQDSKAPRNRCPATTSLSSPHSHVGKSESSWILVSASGIRRKREKKIMIMTRL